MRDLTYLLFNFVGLGGFLIITLAAEVVGKVIFVSGEVRAVDANDLHCALTRGDKVFAGDSVVTYEGKIQIKLRDGGYASIKPRTEYSLAKYVYRGDADGSERGLFRLLKGAVRFVAGAIGKENRRNFRISTNTATIGIRGSGGLVEQYESGGVRCTKIHTHERSSDLLPMVLGLEQHYREGDQHHYIESNPALRLLHTSLTDGPKRQ